MSKLPVITLALVLAAPTWAGESFEERAAADMRGTVEIHNTAGEVEVRGWDKAEVEATGELGSGVLLEFEPEGDRTLIRVRYPSGRHSGSTELQVRLPETSRVNISTVSAEIIVEGVKGAQRLQSVSGDIETGVWGEDVAAKSVSGDIEIQGHDEVALLSLVTVSGDAEARNVSGEVVATSVSGDLEFVSGTLSRARLKTTSGDVGLGATMAPDARFDLGTVNGDVQLALDGDVDAEFEVETLNGDIENCFGPEAVRKSKYGPGRELQFQLGEGSARVRIETINGNVYLCDD